MIIAQGGVVPTRKTMSILGMLAEVVPELVVTKGFVITFGEGVSETECSKSADKTDGLAVDDDSQGIVGMVVRMFKDKGIRPCMVNTEVGNPRKVVLSTRFTVVARHCVIVGSMGKMSGNS